MSDSSETPLAEAVGDSTVDAGVSSWLEDNDPEGDDESLSIHDFSDGLLGERAKDPADAEDAEDAETPAEVETDDAAETEASEGEGDADYEKAISALRRAKLSKEVIGTLSREQVIKEGLAMAEGQAATDARFEEHSKTVQELKEQRERKESGEEAGDVESAAHPSSVTLQAATKDFADALGLDESDIGPSLAKFSDAITEPVQKQVSQGVEVLTQLDRIVGSLLFTAARTGLSSGDQARFPQLADQGTYQKVQAKAQQLISSGSYGDMDPMESVTEAMSDAAGIILRSSIEGDARAKVTKERTARTRGAARRPGSQKMAKEATAEERASSLLDDLERKAAR